MVRGKNLTRSLAQGKVQQMIDVIIIINKVTSSGIRLMCHACDGQCWEGGEEMLHFPSYIVSSLGP